MDDASLHRGIFIFGSINLVQKSIKFRFPLRFRIRVYVEWPFSTVENRFLVNTEGRTKYYSWSDGRLRKLIVLVTNAVPRLRSNPPFPPKEREKLVIIAHVRAETSNAILLHTTKEIKRSISIQFFHDSYSLRMFIA